MAGLKTFSELSLKKDKDLKNLMVPIKGPKGTSKYSRMKVAYHNGPGTADIKKAVNASVQSADRKPERYTKPDGKIGIRMVRVDKEIIKKESIVDPNDLKGRPKKADPNPESPYGIKHPLHPANLKKKKVKTEASSPSVLKPTKPSDITKHARTLAKSSDDYERNKKKYIDKARSKVFKMYPRESLNGLMKEEITINEAMPPFWKVLKKNRKLISNDHGTTHRNNKFYVIFDEDDLDDLSTMDSERIFNSLKKNKGVAYPENDITAYFKTLKDAKQFVKDMGGPGSMYGKFGRLDVVGESVDEAKAGANYADMKYHYMYHDDAKAARAHATKVGGKVLKGSGKRGPEYSVKYKNKNYKESVDEARWPDEMPPETDKDVDEALNMSQRIKRSRLMKRLKGRIAVGRRRAKKKMANKDTLTKRSNRQARNQIAKKLTRGVPKSELTFARKQEIEKRLDKPALKQRIARLAKRMFKDVRKKEVERKKG